MATTSMWKVENELGKLINYATNPEKTKNIDYENRKLYNDLHNVLEYAKESYKTEKQLYVTGINCSKDTALEEMMMTKRYFKKTGGILAFHGFQSFEEGEVTPEIAHEIGVRLAEELWGDRFEAIVSTHLNTDNIHNHFVLNSVSFKDGKKYTNSRRDYALMRETSDLLCEEYGLNVLDKKSLGKHRIDYSVYYNSYVKKETFFTIAKDDVDFAIKQAKDYDDFIDILEDMNYKITVRAHKLSIVKPPYKRNIRIERAFGEEYSINNIEERIKISEPDNSRQFLNKNYKFKKYKTKRNDLKNKVGKKGSIYRLYLYYCYLLKVFPTTPRRTTMTEYMKKSIKEMDKLSEETRFLARNKINTSEELFLYEKNLFEEMNLLTKRREHLRDKKYRVNSSEEKQKIYDEILSLSSKISYLKVEVGYCDDIEKRSKKIVENLKQANENEKILQEKNKKRKRGKRYERFE